MGKSRDTGNLVSANNIFVDIVNDRVGIGSLTPSLKLDVIGSSYISGNFGVGRNNPQQKIENSGAYLTFGQTTANQTSSGSFDFSSGGSARILSWGAVGVNGTISFWTGQGNSGTTQKAIINGVGNLGIGSDTPSSKLDVSGEITLSSSPFIRNIPTIGANYTVTSTYNEMSVGPITIGSGVTVTVNSGATWTIV